MSFGGLFDDEIPYGSSAMPAGAISQRCLAAPSLSKPAFSSPGLSLALTNMEGQGDRTQAATAVGSGAGGGVAGRDLDVLSRKREDENESRSGSDHVEFGSSDDMDQENPRKKKKRYHRHTPQQIQELEALFKECPHPDEKQRLELSKRLRLETRQVKFWFQNRRTQMKTQLERHENAILRQENEKLRAENLAIREATRNPICTNCGGPAVLGEVSLEEQHLRLENARLKDELDRLCALAGKFLGKPLSLVPGPLPLPISSGSSLDLAVGSNHGFAGLGSGVADFATGASSPLGTVITPTRANIGALVAVDDKSLYLELALAAMEELVKMAHMEEPLWVPSLDGGRESLNLEEHQRLFPRCTGMKPVGFVSEATRESGLAIISSMALVDNLMDAARWMDMFPCMIARATTAEVICGGMNATRHGALQLMHAELQVLSPLVPVREINFLRFCKQLAEGTWAVVDVSIEGARDDPSALPSSMKCRRLPSGCVVQDMPNGYSKVTWVEHAEYDEAAVHPLYRPLLRSGLGLGAPRWLASLQRHCQCLALVSDPTPTALITPAGKRSMLKLARRMTESFCAGVCASAARKWRTLPGEQRVGTVEGEEVRVFARQSVDEPGEPAGVVLSAATAVWLPWVAPGRVFDFLRDEGLRSEWDILSNGGPMQEMARIGKGPGQANAVSLLRASAVNVTQSSMLILQETCSDASGSMVVYAPVDVPAMHLVMSGGDSSCVALLPSGFVVLPHAARKRDGSGEGSLLTVAFQILVNSQPTAKLTMESVETVNNLISCTVHKIKAALHCETV